MSSELATRCHNPDFTKHELREAKLRLARPNHSLADYLLPSSRHSTMIAKILEKLTGKDDLERVAYKENPTLLNAYLKKRPVFVPQKPKQFLDASTFTEEQLLELVRKDSEQLSSDQFEPWILEVDGKKRLPVFSSQERMQAFASQISQDMNKVFGLGGVSILLEDVTKHVAVDYVDLNLFSKKSWELVIGIWSKR